MKFSILVVCLNAGEKLHKTIDSILCQTCDDYEIVVKDGGSTDGSIEGLPADHNIRVIKEKDSGIYDAMNQAAAHAEGEFVYYLNCGDYFADETVLAALKEYMEKHPEGDIYYGNIYDRLTNSTVSSNPQIDAFACYRNVPCHQACFYRKTLVTEHPFNIKYRVRADYEQFLWCFFKAQAKCLFTDIQVASYEGGGFSETAQNRKKSAAEHKEITAAYMTKGQLFKFKAIMLLTLAPLRTWMSHSPVFGKVYNLLKKCLYR